MTRAPLRALAVTLSAQTLTAMSQSVPVVLAPVVAPQLGLGPESIGYFTGLIYLTAMLSGMMLSTAINEFGAVRFSQVSMLACAVGLFAATVGSVWVLACAALLLGVGYGLSNPTAALILGRHAPAARRGLYFSLKQTGVPLGIALTGLLVPALLVRSDWQFTAAFVGMLCLLCALLLQPTVALFDTPLAGATPSRGRARLLGPLKTVLAQPMLRRLGSVSFGYAGTQVCFLTFLVVYLTQERSMSLTLAASTLAAGQITSVIGRPLWGWVADRTGNPALILALLGLAMGISLAVLAWLPDAVSVMAAFAASMFCGFTAVAWNGVYYAELVRHAEPSTLAEVTGGVQFMTFAGAMTGPVLFGLAVTIGGSYWLAFSLLAVAPFLIGIWMLFSTWERHPAPGSKQFG